MPTLGEISARIADDLARVDLTTQIKAEVLDSIRDYQGRRFWFNETRAYTFNTVVGQSDYTLAVASGFSDFTEVDWLQITVNGRVYDLCEGAAEWIDQWLADFPLNTGQPTDWCYYGATFRLYPRPDAVYPVRIAGLGTLTALSADGDSNAWTMLADDLLRARGKWRVYKHVIRDDTGAARQEQPIQDALTRLTRETAKRIGTGRIVPTQF